MMQPTRTLLRGLEVLEALATSDDPTGPTGIVEVIGYDKATVGRLLFTLCEAGYATQVGNGNYRVTGKLLELASQISLQPRLRDCARPHLVALRDETEETVHLGVREDDRVIYIDKIDGTHPVRLMSAVGQTMPLHTTALGKVALAWMERPELEDLLARLELRPRTSRSICDAKKLHRELAMTKNRGFSIDDRENEEHALCIGAPIIGSDGDALAMVSLSGPSYRMTDRVAELGEKVKAAADLISKECGSGRRSGI